MEGNHRIARAEPARGRVQGLTERLAQQWTGGNAMGIRLMHRVARSLTCDRRALNGARFFLSYRRLVLRKNNAR